MDKVSVIGAGSWGTALAILCNRAGRSVTLYARNKILAENIRQKNQNDRYLPSIYLDPSINVTNELQEACRTDVLILAVPAQHLRATVISLSDFLASDIPIVISSKGIERGSLSLMTEVVQGVLPANPVAVIAGPNFAYEAASGLPTATSIASDDKKLAQKLTITIGSTLFRPYMTDDVIGAQVGGAVKNVIAIACGIAMGKRLGENARAALITRGIIEIGRLCVKKGGKFNTLMGLCGYGDLVLTCTSMQSRNMTLGYALGQGKKLKEITAGRTGITEGIETSQSVRDLAKKYHLEMPICQAVYDILHEGAGIDDAINELLERPFTEDI